MLRSKLFMLTTLAMLASACGGSGEVYIVGARACIDDVDCAEDCPEDTTATCQDKACLCTDTETVEVPVEGPPKVCESASECSCDSGEEASCTEGLCHCTSTETVVEPGCEADTDCPCISSELYTASCNEGVCFCMEIEKECYPLTRCEVVEQLVGRMIDLSTYVAPMDPYFSDVPTGHECFVPVQAAVELGLFSAGDPPTEFHPDDGLNRAELSKVFITGIDGLADYIAPTAPTYVDVPSGAWYFDYVEAATQLGLTQGYVNSDGTPTGYYGPGDTASSCFLDAMMARAEFPEADTDPISITLETYSGNHNLIVVAGWSEIFSADYKVFGTSATNPLNSIRVINQPDGEGTPPKPTSALSHVYISCGPPSGSGNYTFYASVLDSSGAAQFSNLNCYDETGNGLTMQLSYDIASMATVGESLSGQVFRLVLDDDRLLGNQQNVITSTVRKSRLIFDNVPSSAMLSNGERTLFSFQATAFPGGSVGLARLSFEVDKHDHDGGGELNLNHFKFFRGSSQVNGVMIHDTNGTNLGGAQVLAGSRVIVTFANEETIGAGTTQAFTLKATAMGVEADDSISSYIYPGDDYLPITGMTSELNPNSGRLVSSLSTVGLFPTLNQFNAGNPQSNLSLIWSDRSADVHVYSLADSASSYDWTNGYGHELWALSGTVLIN